MLLAGHHLRALKTRPPVPVADGAGTSFFAAVRFPALLAIPDILLMMPFFAGAAFFVTTVVPVLVFELSLLLLTARPRPCLGGTGGPVAAAARLPRSEPVEADANACLAGLLGAFRELSPVPSILASEAVAVCTDVVGFTGDMGRARYDFPGDVGALIGD
jgi:hypothetical protein